MGATRSRMDPIQRQRQVLEVAAGVFARKGYRAANVTDIVNGAGIGRGTFYLYFSSKQEVFLALVEQYFTDLSGLLAENRFRLEMASKGPGGNMLEVWRENILRILQYHKDNPDVTSVVYRDAVGSDGHFSSRVRELADVANLQLKKMLEKLNEIGVLRECNLEVAVTILMGSVVSVTMKHVIEDDGIELETLADELMSYHMRALLSEEAEKQAAIRETGGRG